MGFMNTFAKDALETPRDIRDMNENGEVFRSIPEYIPMAHTQDTDSHMLCNARSHKTNALFCKVGATSARVKM